jgi:uncharacterized protein (DUF983 family)
MHGKEQTKATNYMCAQKATKEHGGLWSVVHNKCPRCRQGDLFLSPNAYDLKNTMKMPDSCPVCGQQYELQTGFYFGTGFVSYAISVFVSGLTFLIWWFTVGMSVSDNRVFWWLAVNAGVLVLIQPVVQRLARAIWISFFVRYDADAGHVKEG